MRKTPSAKNAKKGRRHKWISRRADILRASTGASHWPPTRRSAARERALARYGHDMHVTDERGDEVRHLLSAVPSWATRRSDVRAVGLCGSWARDAQRMSSDVDLVVLTESPGLYVDADEWLHDFGSPPLVRTQQWGVLTERRVRLSSGLEVEFGFADLAWAALTPVDAGTRRVVTDGMRPLYDPADLLSAVVAACAAGPDDRHGSTSRPG
jgi:hypothetical protein